ncbi:MAG: DUF4402 domain-containing protein [Mariniphaga sp.]
MNSPIQLPILKRLSLPFCLTICLVVLFLPVIAQEKPPKPISVQVSTLQHLNFGTFIQTGSSGTVTVTYDGARSATGGVILPNTGAFSSSALFEVTALPGTLITIMNGPNAILTGSNSGTLVLQPGESSTRSPFIATTEITNVFIGGTLIVGSMSANPAGEYSGTFQVTFIQQ